MLLFCVKSVCAAGGILWKVQIYRNIKSLGNVPYVLSLWCWEWRRTPACRGKRENRCVVKDFLSFILVCCFHFKKILSLSSICVILPQLTITDMLLISVVCRVNQVQLVSPELLWVNQFLTVTFLVFANILKELNIQNVNSSFLTTEVTM